MAFEHCMATRSGQEVLRRPVTRPCRYRLRRVTRVCANMNASPLGPTIRAVTGMGAAAYKVFYCVCLPPGGICYSPRASCGKAVGIAVVRNR